MTHVQCVRASERHFALRWCTTSPASSSDVVAHLVGQGPEAGMLEGRQETVAMCPSEQCMAGEGSPVGVTAP